MAINIIINIKINMKKQILIYKLEGVDPQNGVDLFEIIPTLENLGLLIKESGQISLETSEIEVKVKPFKAGSFEIDLLVGGIVNLFSGNEVNALNNLLGLIGFGMGIIKFVQGRVNQYKKVKNKIIYYNSDNQEQEVDIKTHQFIQNDNIQKALNGAIATPMKNISGVDGVSFQTESQDNKISISNDDLDSLEEYNKLELDDDSNKIENVTNMYVKPERGSYSGGEKQYTFIAGKDNKLYPTTIQDEGFINKLKNGTIRLFHEDILFVKLRTKQKISKKTGKITNEYFIEEVLEYIDHKNMDQQRLDIK